MRPVLCALCLIGCYAPTAPLVRQTPNLTMAWDSTFEVQRKLVRGLSPCAMRPSTSVIVVNGMRYVEILYVCD